MAKEGQTGLEAIAGAARQAFAQGPADRWNPPDCGDIDLRIAADGTWYYQDTPIGRPALVRLFAAVLRRDGDRYCLVTPVEKCGIRVDDAPFLAVEMAVTSPPARPPTLAFRTNVDDWVTCDRDHPLRFAPEPNTGGLKPYLHVRQGLWALLTRPLFYDLVARGETREWEGRRMFGVPSGDSFFPMAPADSLEGIA